MAAYAALVSLLNTVEQINSLNQKIQLYDPLCSLVYDTEQVESLGEKTRFLLDFIEANDRSRGGGKAAAADLEAMITSAAHAAEDEIESQVLDLIGAAPSTRSDKHPPMILLLDLKTLLEEMDRVKENVIKFKQGENESKPPTYVIPATSSSSRSDQANTHDEKSQLLLHRSRSRGGGKAAAADLEAWITSVAYAAEDEIELQVLDHIEAAPDCSTLIDEPPLRNWLLDLMTQVEEMDRVEENVIKFKQGENESKPPTYAIPATSSSSRPDQANTHDGKSQLLIHRSRGGGKAAATDLEAMITSVAHAAEDEIESQVVDHIEAAPDCSTFINEPPLRNWLLDLMTQVEEMDLVEENVIKFKQGENESKQPTYAIPATSSSSSRPDQDNNTHDGKSGSMIGFDDELNQLLEILVGWESSRKIIPVQGMGGIGKTTLARNTYQHLTVVNHFDMRAWATVSQTYTRETVLLEILQSWGSRSSDSEDEQILGVKLHKILSGRRYLLVLDDVWTAEALEDMLSFFPDNRNGSRIVVTTRLSNMGTHFGSSSLSMNLLDEGKSWDLLREKAFGKEAYLPPQLERIGRHIAKKCKGLPLSITVIGRLLGESSMTEEYWSSVANDMNSILNSGEEENVLSLSYTHLPARLKPCFLYMGVFPEDQVIDVSWLIMHWVAEGFLKPIESQSLEETAESHLMELVGRNLILAHKWDIVTGKLKSLIIHDLLRDLSLRIAEKENFLRAINLLNHTIDRPDVARDRRLVIDASIPVVYYQVSIPGADLKVLQSASLVRSLFYDRWQCVCFELRYLRVLDGDCSSDHLLNVMSSTFNIRFLAFDGNFSVVACYRFFCPSMLKTYWPNLQTLSCGNGEFLDRLDIWNTMPQLRHLFGRVIRLLDPARDSEDGFALSNLQTLGTVRNMRLSEELCKRIPNVRTLGLAYTHIYRGGYGCLRYLCRFDKLERLSLNFFEAHFDSFPPNLKLPSSLMELSLKYCEVGWEYLSVIGSLPNLRVLRLKNLMSNGNEWNPVEGQFPALKYLEMEGCSELTRWNADSCHFPVLEELYMIGLPNLEEIPLGFGDTPTLRLIRLEWCSAACAISALNILEEQESLGNEALHVRISVHPEEVQETLAEKVGSLQTNTKKNLQLEDGNIIQNNIFVNEKKLRHHFRNNYRTKSNYCE